MIGVISTLDKINNGIDITNTPVSRGLKNRKTTKYKTENIESNKSVRALPVRNLRIFSSSPNRLDNSPTGFESKNLALSLKSLDNILEPKLLSILLVIYIN